VNNDSAYQFLCLTAVVLICDVIPDFAFRYVNHQFLRLTEVFSYLYIIHLCLSISRSVDGGPCKMVLRCPVLPFPPPYLSQSCVFHSRVFSVYRIQLTRRRPTTRRSVQNARRSCVSQLAMIPSSRLLLRATFYPCQFLRLSTTQPRHYIVHSVHIHLRPTTHPRQPPRCGQISTRLTTTTRRYHTIRDAILTRSRKPT